MIKKAEDVAAGRRALKRDRFVRIDGAITSASIKKILKTLLPLRSAVITTGDATTVAPPAISPQAAELLRALNPGGH